MPTTARKFTNQVFVYGISTIVQRLLSSLLTPLYTRAYAPKTYSIFSTMFSYASILQALLALGMETTFFRFLNNLAYKKNQVYSNCFQAVFIGSLVFLSVTLPFTDTLAGWIKIGNTSPHEFAIYIRYFAAVLVLDAWSAIPFARLRADGRTMRYGAIKLVNIGINVLLNIIFIVGIPYWTKHGLYGSRWFAGWYIPGWIGYVFLSNVVASFVSFVLLLPEVMRVRPGLDKAMVKDMLIYSGPILVANLSYIVNENLDKILLGKLLPANISEQQVGIYSACARMSIFLSLFNQAFRLGAEPFYFSRSQKKNAAQTYALIMHYFVIAACVVFIAVIANIQILKHYIDNKAYWVGLDVVPPLLFGYVSLGIYMNLSVWYKLTDQTHFGLYISGAGAVVTIVLNVVFIPGYGYMASAYASLAAYTVMMVMSYIWGQRYYPIPYRARKDMLYILLALLFVYFSFYVYRQNIYIGNAFLLVFIAVAFFVDGKELKRFMRGEGRLGQ